MAGCHSLSTGWVLRLTENTHEAELVCMSGNARSTIDAMVEEACRVDRSGAEAGK